MNMIAHQYCGVEYHQSIQIFDDDDLALMWRISRVSCQKGPICHAYAWRVGPFWQDTIDMKVLFLVCAFAYLVSIFSEYHLKL